MRHVKEVHDTSLLGCQASNYRETATSPGAENQAQYEVQMLEIAKILNDFIEELEKQNADYAGVMLRGTDRKFEAYMNMFCAELRRRIEDHVAVMYDAEHIRERVERIETGISNGEDDEDDAMEWSVKY